MEKKFVVIMITIILLLAIIFGVRLATGPGINFNFDGIRNISLPEIGLFSNDTEADDEVMTQGNEEENISDTHVIPGRWPLFFASPNPLDHPEAVMMAWAVQEIYARTNGGVHIEYFPAGQLGDARDILESLEWGILEKGVVSSIVSADSRLAIDYIPYLVTSYEEAKRVWTNGSKFFEILSEIMESKDLKLLGILPSGLRGIGTTQPFNPATVWDFDQPSDELLIRLPTLWIFQNMADAMQLRAVPISYDERFHVLQTGVVDGWVGGSPEVNYVEFRDVINYFYDFRYDDYSYLIIINRSIYYALSENYRAIIFEVMQEASVRAIEEQAERSAYYLQRMRDHGIRVLQPTDAQREQMREAMIRRGWPQIMDELGFDQDVKDRLLEDVR